MQQVKFPRPMLISRPEHRYDEVVQTIKDNTGRDCITCDYQKQLYDYFILGEADSYSAKAYSLYYNQYTKASLNSLLICNEPIPEIAAAIEEDELVILAYSRLFFDTGVFPNKLIKLSYIRQLPGNNQAAEFEKQLMIAAIQLGPKYIYWKLGIDCDYSPPTEKVYLDLMKDSFWKFKELRVKNDMEITKEARSWVPVAISAANSVDKSGSKLDNSLSEPISIKLISISNSLNSEALGKDLKG